MLYPRDMTEKPQQFKIDWMLIIGGLATIITGTAGNNPIVLALPISVFTFVLAILRIWIKPKAGQRFFSPGIWWGTIYSVLGVVFALIGAQSLFIRDITAQQIGVVVMVTAIAQLVIPGAIVVYLGYRRSVAHNKTLLTKPE